MWLKLQPYRQHSVDRRRCQKLVVKFYGPYQIEKKISMVAYRLTLPPTCCIFPMFHISLLKRFQGEQPKQATVMIPPLSLDSHLIVVLHKIMAYRLVNKKGKKVEQVLVEWIGLGPDEKTWEDVSTTARLAPSSKL